MKLHFGSKLVCHLLSLSYFKYQTTSFFLLEPTLLFQIQLNEQENDFGDFNTKLNETKIFNLTIGVFDKDFLQINLGPFSEVSRIECQRNYENETPFHVFYRFPDANLNLHLIVFLVDEKQENAVICPACPLKQRCLGLQIPDFTSCLLFEEFVLSVKYGVPVPKNILGYLSQLPPSALDFLTPFEKVKAVDAKLRLFAQKSIKSSENYIHPSATAQDLLSHNASDPGPTMKTARQLEQAFHLSLDIDSPCGGNLGLNLNLLVLVFNRAADFVRRQAIRETYGGSLQRNPSSALYFFIAKPEDSPTQQKILKESAHYGDIIQVDYFDSYYNCTIKAVAMIRWTALHCPYVKFMLKLDDDSFLRPRPFLGWLQEITPNHIYGGEVSNKPLVGRIGKWAISRRYYPAKRNPTFLNGVYLIPGHYTLLLYQAVLSNLPALPFEDVYITGILAQMIGLSHVKGARMTCKFTDYLEPAGTFTNTYLLFNKMNSTGIRVYWNAWKEES